MKESIVCPACGLNKPIEDFSVHARRKNGRATYCKKCQAIKQKAWYEKNKDRHKKNTRRRTIVVIEENRKRLYRFLLDNPCVDCGEKNPIVLEFDHVRGSKSNDIARLLNGGNCWDTIEKEIEKCEVRCANCHRLATAKRGNWKMLNMHP